MEIVQAGKGSMRKLLASEHESLLIISITLSIKPQPESESKPSSGTTKLVKALYKALARNNTKTIARLVVTDDLEWWFRGPPHCQHMMRMLTGKSRHVDQFKFKPRSTTAFGDRVIVEGWKGSINEEYYWVHVWSVKDGMITQLREYFDIRLTVIFRVMEARDDDDENEIIWLWKSEPKERLNRSLPDVVLAV